MVMQRLPWKNMRFQIFAKPRPLTHHERKSVNPEGECVVIIDPATRTQLPPGGKLCNVITFTQYKFWRSTEEDGDVEISFPDTMSAGGDE